MRCCFNTFAITTGAKIMAGVIVFFAGLSIIGSATNAQQLPGEQVAGGIVSAVVNLVCAVLVFFAIEKQRAALMIPILVITALGIVGCVVLTIFLIVAIFSKGLSVAVLIIMIIAGAIEIWFFVVFRNCYVYLKENSGTGVSSYA